MSDDSDFTAPCGVTNEQGVRCVREAHFLNGEPVEHEHQFPSVVTRDQVDLTGTYGDIVQRVGVGMGHEILVMRDGCFRFAHDCDRHVRFPGSTLVLRVAPALQFGPHRPEGQQGHTIDVRDNFAGFPVINVMPSILCDDCGTHGFVNNGQWVPA